jgi:nitroreductase
MASERASKAASERFGEKLEPATVSHEAALATLNERAVCRRYRQEPVSEDVLRLLCATALAAPTKSDLQQATIVRIRDPAKRSAINALLHGSPWVAGAPEFLIFCADGWRLRRVFARSQTAFVNDHLDSFFNATVDCAITMATFVAAAELAGLGSCPISQIRDHAEAVDSLLDLPDWVVPVAGLVLGYPQTKEPVSPRLALSATVHTDCYDTAAVEKELAAYGLRRKKDWASSKVKQYGIPLRDDFGRYVTSKRFSLK